MQDLFFFSFIVVQLERGAHKSSEKNLLHEKIPIYKEIVVRKLPNFWSKFGVRQGALTGPLVYLFKCLSDFYSVSN